MATTRVVAGGHEGDGGHGGRGVRMRWGGDLGCEGETKRARGKDLREWGAVSGREGSRHRGDVALIPSPTGTATGFGGDQRARSLGRVNREEGGDRGRWAAGLGRPDDKGPGGSGGVSFSFTSALFFLQKKHGNIWAAKRIL